MKKFYTPEKMNYLSNTFKYVFFFSLLSSELTESRHIYVCSLECMMRDCPS